MYNVLNRQIDKIDGQEDLEIANAKNTYQIRGFHKYLFAKSREMPKIRKGIGERSRYLLFVYCNIQDI